MPHIAERRSHGNQPNTTLVSHRLPKELIYTKSGRIGFFQSETAHSVTIRLGPHITLTVPKDEIDCRVPIF